MVKSKPEKSTGKKARNIQTSKLERTNVGFPLWRKKVDNSLFQFKGTTVPIWAQRMWEFDRVFPGIVKTADKVSEVTIELEGKEYKGKVVSTHPRKRAQKVYRFYFSDELLVKIKETFLMSFMRNLESQLRKDSAEIEDKIPFWEFLDIEFDAKKKRFILSAHYTQLPTFPELFRRMIYSPVIKRIDDELSGKEGFRIYKQDWRPRSEFEAEIGAENVIYMLVDTKSKLLYVGEAEKLVPRFIAGHPSISGWDYYRYDQLPPVTKEIRVALERMIIRSFAGILQNKKNIEFKQIDGFLLANDKIDA